VIPNSVCESVDEGVESLYACIFDELLSGWSYAGYADVFSMSLL